MTASGLVPEAQARVLIDERLRAAGWHVCDRSQIVDELQAALAEIQAISDDLVELGVDPE